MHDMGIQYGQPYVLTVPCALGRRYTGVPYDQKAVRIKLGDTLLMDAGQPLDFDATAASIYLKETAAVHGTVRTLDYLP